MAVALDPRGIAWVCAGGGSLFGLDVRSPARPRHIALLAMSGCAASVSAGTRVYVAGNGAEVDTAVPQNLGLYQFAQPQPGQVLPDRYSDQAPVAHVAEPIEPLKARVLGGLEPAREVNPGIGRAFRREKPVVSAGSSRKQ
jgi:hypothetical protein